MRSHTNGFTFLEMMMVLVIASILVLLVAPRLFESRESWYLATLQSDLKNFVLAEKQYFIIHDEYGSDSEVIGVGLFNATKGVTLLSGESTALGFNATAMHERLVGGEVCGVYVGNATKPDPSLTAEGEIGCF